MQVLFSGKYVVRSAVWDFKPDTLPSGNLETQERIQEAIAAQAQEQGIDATFQIGALYEYFPKTPMIQRIWDGLIVFTQEHAQQYRDLTARAKQYMDTVFINTDEDAAAEIAPTISDQDFLDLENTLEQEMDQWLDLMQNTPLTADNALDTDGKLTFSVADGKPLP